uniref:Uncharacterized protein n=1 Tax=mine drainage metagenome TaxID=410659 RepID=E6QN96_9ZZZZ
MYGDSQHGSCVLEAVSLRASGFRPGAWNLFQWRVPSVFGLCNSGPWLRSGEDKLPQAHFFLAIF